MFTFRRGYLLLTIVLLIIEIAIALFVKDEVIRPNVGDLLVVILVYSFIRSFCNVSVYLGALSALLFCILIETLQYFNIVKVLGLDELKIASVAIGHSFDLLDLLMYTIGILIVLIIEKLRTANAI